MQDELKERCENGDPNVYFDPLLGEYVDLTYRKQILQELAHDEEYCQYD